MKTEFDISRNRSVPELREMARRIRLDIVQMVVDANSGHIGGSLSAADLVTALYFHIMRVDPSNPGWDDRDRFILSKGHACPVWYAALANRGFFDRMHLKTLRKLNSILQGHADMRKTPGVDMTAGSLGHGLSAGVGMALAARLNGKKYHVWVVLGDGECQEGSVWEAAMSAAKWKLDNLTIVIDRNGLQNDATVEVVMPLEPLAAKWEAFRWNVMEINGHDMEQIVETFEKALTVKGLPTAIIANTVKGKGVSFMENVREWHGRVPNAEQTRQAIAELLGDIE